jgi:GxxExxY protein
MCLRQYFKNPSHKARKGTERTKEIIMNENDIGSIVVDTALYLHKKLGPGLLESVYESILMKLIKNKGLTVHRQVSIPVEFEGEHFINGFRADLLIEGKVIIELKSVENIKLVHKKQLLTYLKLTNTKLGYILNFGTELMKDGIFRIINGSI